MDRPESSSQPGAARLNFLTLAYSGLHKRVHKRHHTFLIPTDTHELSSHGSRSNGCCGFGCSSISGRTGMVVILSCRNSQLMSAGVSGRAAHTSIPDHGLHHGIRPETRQASASLATCSGLPNAQAQNFRVCGRALSPASNQTLKQ